MTDFQFSRFLLLSMSRFAFLCAALALSAGCGNDSEKGGEGTAGDEGKSPAKARPKFKQEVDWSSAREQTAGPLKVKIDSVEIGPAPIGNEQAGYQPSGERYLLVRLTLANIGQESRLRYSGWSTPGAAIGGHVGRLLDENDKSYPAKTDFGDEKHVQGQVRKPTDILQTRPLTEVLVFAAPPDDVQQLRLELPASVVLEDGSLRFAIPAVVIQRSVQ
jgi:hypothetical protein